MKKIYLVVMVVLFCVKTSAQIDGNLLLGLTPVSNLDIATIISPPEGALFYNTDERKIYLNTGSGFTGIPSLDTNSIDFWNSIGNAGIDPSIHFIGTTDAQDFIFRTNNIEAARILQSNQFIGIGTNAPTERLDVNGSLRVRNITTTASDLDVLVTTATGVVEKRPFSDFSGGGGASVSTDPNNGLSTGTDSGIFYESPIKGHGKVAGDGSILNAAGISGVVRDAEGIYTVTLANAMPNANYTIQLTAFELTGNNKQASIVVDDQTATTFTVEITDMSNAAGTGGNKSPIDLDWYFVVLN